MNYDVIWSDDLFFWSFVDSGVYPRNSFDVVESITVWIYISQNFISFCEDENSFIYRFCFFQVKLLCPPPRKKIASKKENKGSNQTTAIDINFSSYSLPKHVFLYIIRRVINSERTKQGLHRKKYIFIKITTYFLLI